MSEQLFLHPSAELQSRWQQAFPEAKVVSSLAGFRALPPGLERVVWLDFTPLEADERFDWLQALVNQQARVVVLSANPSEAEALQVMQAGAKGYCHELAAPGQLEQVAMVVGHGGLWVGPDLMHQLMKLTIHAAQLQHQGLDRELMARLTSREQGVAREVARGSSNHEIADTLEISERTVKAHLSAIFDKLEVRDRVQLALKLNQVRH